jgi:hypothetical protein
LQPLQEEDADELTVCPPAPFETNPQADISLLTLVLSQSGQAGVSWPNTRRSNWQPQPLHWYSKMGIIYTPYSRWSTASGQRSIGRIILKTANYNDWQKEIKTLKYI